MQKLEKKYKLCWSEKMDRKQQIELTNMCLVYDENRILVEEKKGTKYAEGLVFPGGHIEPGESLLQSVIREIKEETGLDIWNLELCGVKQWFNDSEGRNVCFLFKTNSFSGELISSDEGENFWIKKKDILNYYLANNFNIMYKVFEDKNINEHYHSKDKDILK